jgi:membrane-associated phospholipid phosphatase
MKNIISLVNSNRIYFTAFCVIIFLSCFLLVIPGNAAACITLDAFHPFWLNVFFINYTFMGNGFFALSLISVLFFYYGKKQQAYTLLSSVLISGFVIQVLKNLVNASLPKIYFEAGTYLQYTDGITLSTGSGSVSAHTATAFAIATVLALMIKNKKMQLLIVVAAALVGYSRMYLAGHFLTDVITGALTGTVSGSIAVILTPYHVGIKRSFTKLPRIGKKRPRPPLIFKLYQADDLL